MESDEENVNTLLMMGFPDAHEIRRALRMAKNDLNEAVSILTNEQGNGNYSMDVQEGNQDGENVRRAFDVYSPVVVPCSYEEVVESAKKDAEFPVTNLYELESRVFVNHWSIPYKKEESLGKCLLSATRLAQEGLCDADENCKRFMERCMPEAFKKLLTSAAVRRWNPEIQEGIFNMLEILVDLVVARLKCGPVPEFLLSTSLVMAFDPECEWHVKNKSRRWNVLYWEEIFGGQANVYAASPSANLFKDSNGWLVDLINRFAHQGGFEQIQLRFEQETLQDSVSAMSALLKPLSLCAEYFNTSVICPILLPCMDRAVNYVRSLQNCDLRHKKMSCISDLLSSMKLLCVHLWPQRVELVNSLRLEIIVRMLKSTHFNSRMNGLKEVIKLIDDTTAAKNNKAAIESDALLDWISQSNLLSIALEGNIDHVQYTDRLKAIVEFVGPRLSLDELTKIWKMQIDQNNQVVDNIYAIMAAASAKFNAQQFDHLFTLIQKNWQEENVGMREKLLTLIGKIGREARPGKTSTKVLDLLWDLAHLPSLPTPLVEQALDEHLSILNDAAFKDQVKKNYIIKCIEDVKKNCCVLPALRQLHNIASTVAKPTIHKHDKAALSELNKTHEVVKLTTSSLSKCHKNASTLVGNDKTLMPETLVDGRYTHREFVNCHLNFLQFMLREGDLYLSWNRCKEIWDTLVSNPDACHFDREVCFDWFSQCLEDLESDTRSQMFQQKLLKMDAALLTMKAFHCFKIFFESVNLEERKLKRVANFIVVDRLDPIGMDFLWQVVLYAQNEDIADIAIDNILDFSYLSLAPRLKKDPVSLHKKFISDCSKRLETAMMTLSGSAMSTAVSSATKTLTAMSVAEVASLPLPSRSVQLQNIRRLLMVAERYTSTIEEMHSAPRTILPHGAAFHGHPITIYVSSCEGTKQEFTLISHSNETLASIRASIGQLMKLNADNLQLASNDKILVSSKDSKLLGQLDFADEQHLVVKVNTIGTSVNPQVKEIEDAAASQPEDDPSSASNSSNNRQLFNFEQEKMLPGVVMASGGQVFEMLYQLTELEDSKITSCVRNLLRLIPTDPSIQDALDSIGTKDSPRSTPKKLNLGNKEKELVCDGVKSLFDAHAVSPFRVLYNLEVLSSKLMPTTCDGGTQQSARIFCDEFLNVGGLRWVINILQKDAMPNEVDYDTRQGCYFTALQLTRFLLCGQTITGYDHDSVAKSSKSSENSNTTFPPAATKAIQTMSIVDFTDTVLCLMRVAWAAAAGLLHLANSTHQPSATISSSSCMTISNLGRSRQSSTGSNTSSGSDGGEILSLHAGVCCQQSHVGPRDSLIARESLELLVTCLQLRSENLNIFYNLTCVSDFIVDTVLGSPNVEIRNKACQQFSRLSLVTVDGVEGVINPHHFLLKVFLKAHLPLWVSSSNARGSNQRLLAQCWQYFDLLCRLLKGLTVSEQESLQINPTQMMEDEIAWLTNFTPSDNSHLKEVDNILLAGHLRLIQILLTCEGIDKKQFGTLIISDLLNKFLFPASWVISEKLQFNSNSEKATSFNPKCSGIEARVSAYNLLQEFALNCVENMEQISNQLIHLHHRFVPELARDFEYEPAVISRSPCGFVGLKNAGATCYMNSVIQELFLIPGVREAILSFEDENTNEDGVFFQFQSVFGHLLDSQLQYFVPANFWKCFKLWGQPVNVREQQDAFEFFMHLIDQVDEYLKLNGRKQIFKNTFEGLFSNQMICQECPHKYEREESFMALNVTVKSHNLQESLDQFVRGEMLEGDNAYFCEKCSEKRNTIKRTCIKKLSKVLVIHLKRFDYDWEANRALKFDDHFKFPWVLDMGPYTAEGILEKEKKSSKVESILPEKISNFGTLYELVGIIVHSGQANAGHYYSFIKDRRSESNNTKGKWFKFNDTTVEEFEMNDATIEAECFGGTYRAKVYDPSSSYPEIRQRYWNGYMLFYEKMDDVANCPRTPRRSSIKRSSFPLTSETSNKDSDGLTQLTELVHHGDREGIFQNRMPSRIQQNVHQDNLHFMQNRDVYCDEYFRFVYDLVRCNENVDNQNDKDAFLVLSVKLAINFLLNTYFRIKNKDITVINSWSTVLASILTKSESATFWMLKFFSVEPGLDYIKSFLLECPNKEVRVAFSEILQKLLDSYFKCSLDTPNQHTDYLIEYLLNLLNKEVPDNCRTCSQYFDLLCAVAQMGRKACAHLFKHSGFRCFLVFLLGPSAFSAKCDEVLPRRWTSFQAREFSALHKTMALLVQICDVTPYRTCSVEGQINSSSSLLPLPDDMHVALFGPRAHQYIREVIIACRESSSTMSSIKDMLLQCSFCNQTFSILVLQQIMLQCSSVPSSELKNIFQLLLEMLVLEDPLQFTRLQCVIDGYTDKSSIHYDGMLAVIKSNHATDSCRSYQCIKFLVHLANKCSWAKDYLMQTPSRWQWAVNWLRKKMSEHTYWNPQSMPVSNEDSNSHSFQRTISAQDTLAEATALLSEVDEMETDNFDEENK